MSLASRASDHAGSLWRRWDPHVHFPGTLHNDQFGDLSIAAALDSLAARTPAIEVVGVTDYFTTATFRRVQAEHASGSGSSLQLLFPNVELRLSHATRAKAAINVHLLCAPDEVDGLDRFLRELTFTYQDQTYRCQDSDLILLGRAYEENRNLDDAAAMRSGALQFKVDFDQLQRASRDAWARAHLLIAVAGGSSDGTSGLQTNDNAFTALRRNIERLAHIIFSGDPKQFEFWSGRGADDEATLRAKYNGKKLCLHGSDAHDAERLGRPDLDRYCWVKGDPSFETLRMACLSPDTRGHIGPRQPMESDTHGRIARVSVPDKRWFPATGVSINPGLVAVIGARGSGKTALADVVAAGAGATEPFENHESFITRAGHLLRGSIAEVEWSHGESTRRDLTRSVPPDPTQPKGVRYLSQQFVEQLCASDGVSDNLLEEIERVVFASVPPGDRQGATDFRELLTIRVAAARGRQADELEAIGEISERITSERLLMRSVPERKSSIEQDAKTLEGLDAKVRELTSSGDQGNADRLALVTAALEARVAKLEAIERRATDLRGLQEKVVSLRTTALPRVAQRLQAEFGNAGLSEEEWTKFVPTLDVRVDGIVSSAIEKASAEASEVRDGTAASPPPTTLEALEDGELAGQPVKRLKAEQERLQAAVGLDRRRVANLQKLNERASTLRAKLQKARNELAEAEGAAARSEAVTEQRLGRYEAYFDALLEEESELRTLYEPLEQLLAKFGTTASKLRLTVRRKVDLNSWTTAGEALLDLRVGGRFKGAGGLRQVAEDELLPAWLEGTGAQAAEAIRAFSVNYSGDLRDQSKARSGDNEAYREWERMVNRWLYSADHVSLTYTLMYDNLTIERLSPGSRGIVLLLLYLAVDRTESDPLIIDQPEENLDPESVYSELVKLFRDASRRRQIIMVTHNANLVVNTDVDQVIVAHSEDFEEGKLPVLTYDTGGLEVPRIRQAVCEVLEGGAEAFRQRARRLSISM